MSWKPTSARKGISRTGRQTPDVVPTLPGHGLGYHVPKRNGTMLDDLAGGAAYARFAHTVIWLEPYHPDRQVVVRQVTPFGSTKSLVTANRGLLLRKVRNGPGGGLQIAFNFNGKKLSFEELGVIIKEDAEES